VDDALNRPLLVYEP
jgi:hypothetical protein